MLIMELVIGKLDEVWTTDEQKLGLAQHLYFREEGIDPDLQFYESYIEVENYDWGSVFYVPTDFVSGRSDQDHRIRLSVTFSEALEQTWTRMPHFVAHGEGRKEDLPEG